MSTVAVKRSLKRQVMSLTFSAMAIKLICARHDSVFGLSMGFVRVKYGYCTGKVRVESLTIQKNMCYANFIKKILHKIATFVPTKSREKFTKNTEQKGDFCPEY